MVFFWAMLILIGMVVADFFVPMLPSATLVTAAAGLVLGSPPLISVLLVGAAGASWLGEFVGYRVFRRIRAGLARRSPRLVRGLVRGSVAKLETLLERTIKDHPYRTTMVARFLPAGRTALAWAAAGTPKPPYARMAALGGALWAVYSVTLGLVIGWIAGPGIQSLIGSVVTVAAVGLVLGWIARRWQRTHTEAPVVAAPAAAIASAEELAVAIRPTGELATAIRTEEFATEVPEVLATAGATTESLATEADAAAPRPAAATALEPPAVDPERPVQAA